MIDDNEWRERQIHLQGVTKAINVNKLTSAGCKMKIWIADWFAMMNNKMGGDLKKIQVIGEYMIEIWKAIGMNIDGGQVEFLWSSEEINSRSHEYWPLVMDIAIRNTITRILRYQYYISSSDSTKGMVQSLMSFPALGAVKLWAVQRKMNSLQPRFYIRACNVQIYSFSRWLLNFQTKLKGAIKLSLLQTFSAITTRCICRHKARIELASLSIIIIWFSCIN